MKLAHHTWGQGPSVSFVHGFTQTHESWKNVISDLNEFSCTSFDAPGHGDSGNGERTLTECGDDLAESMISGTLVGYSMGARMALHAALQHPAKVERLVLVSGTAGIDNDAERAARRESDNSLADHIEQIGVKKFIDEWLSNPMFQNLSHEAAQIPQRIQNTTNGLANSLRYAGTGTQNPLWNRLGELHMPVLIVTGELDTKFTELGQRLHEGILNSELVVVPQAGHTVHLENHDAFMHALMKFLL